MLRSEVAVMRLHSQSRKQNSGLSLVETLVGLVVGCLVGAVMLEGFRIQMVMQKQSLQQMREKLWRDRALERIARDVASLSTTAISTSPAAATGACRLDGHTAVLQLNRKTPPDIIYTVGPAPNRSWRGTVLVRCAPDPSAGGAATARVLIDGLANNDPPSGTLTPWTRCNALLQNPGSELAGSYQLPFSACIQTSNPRIGAVRLQLKNLRYTTEEDRQNSERQIFLGMS